MLFYCFLNSLNHPWFKPSPVEKAGWTLSAAETKVCSNFTEISSKILLVFVLRESHKVMCNKGSKQNGHSCKSGRIIFFSP